VGTPFVLQEDSAGGPAGCSLDQLLLEAHERHDLLAETLAAKLSIEQTDCFAVADAAMEIKQPAALSVMQALHATSRQAGEVIHRSKDTAGTHDAHDAVRTAQAAAGAEWTQTAEATAPLQQHQQQTTQLLHLPPAVLQHVAASCRTAMLVGLQLLLPASFCVQQC